MYQGKRLVPGRGGWALIGFIPLRLFSWRSSVGTQAASESQAPAAGWATVN